MNTLASMWNQMFGIRAELMRIQTSLDNHLFFLSNREKVVASTLERLSQVRERNPDSADRLARLEEIFLSRVTNAKNMSEVSSTLGKLLKTLDRERLY